MVNEKKYFYKKNKKIYFDLISPARKNFRPQTPNDEKVLADETDYIWVT